jgi:hypothetical protein
VPEASGVAGAGSAFGVAPSISSLPPRVDDDSTESNLHFAAVGIGRSERLGQCELTPGNGSIEACRWGYPPFGRCQEGVSAFEYLVCCLLFVGCLMDLPLAADPTRCRIAATCIAVH